MDESSQLRRLAKEHNLRQARLRIDGERKTWLERDQVPEGFDLELHEPLKLFKLRPKPGSYSPIVSGPLEQDAWNTLSTEYREALEKHASSGDWGALGQYENGVLKVIERERSRYQRAYDNRARKARDVLNAWIFLTLKKLVEPLPSEDQEFESLRYDRLDLLARWRQGPGKHITENRREAQKLWVIEHLKEQQGIARLFYYEAHRFWHQLSGYPVLSPNVHPVEQLCADFQALCKGFDAPAELQQSFTTGLTHYREEIAGLADSLVLLECKRVAYEIIQHDMVFDQKPTSWEEVKKEMKQQQAPQNRHSFKWSEKWEQRTRNVCTLLLVQDRQTGTLKPRRGWLQGEPRELFEKLAESPGEEHLDAENPWRSIRRYFERKFEAQGEPMPQDMSEWVAKAREWAPENPPPRLFDES